MTARFLASDESTKEIMKTAVLVQSLSISVLITGERGVGKSLLAAEILPEAAVANGENEDEVAALLLRSNAVIIENFDRIHRVEKLELDKKRIVATASRPIDQSVIDRFFGITLHIPPLAERPNDVQLLAQTFLDEAKNILMINRNIEVENISLDIKDNAHSLRRSIYTALLLDNVDEEELIKLLHKFFGEKLREFEGIDIYRDYLHLYDKPLILAGLNEYGTQLRLATALGINRNTLRKKIYELGIER